MYVKRYTLILALAIFHQNLQSQPTLSTLTRDTIVAKREFMSVTYLLNGKKLNLTVMQWFMSDYPTASSEIKIATLSTQTSVVGFGVGGLFGLSGLFLSPQNKDLSGDMMKIGITGIGVGIVFQLLAGNYKKRATKSYNRAIQNLYKSQGTAHFKFGTQPNGTGIGFAFVF